MQPRSHSPLSLAGSALRACCPAHLAAFERPPAAGRRDACRCSTCPTLSAQVGAYPFTTLRPQLGALRADGPAAGTVVVADIPGLVAGASANRGLGHDFLRHVERTRLLAYVVDLAGGLHGDDGPRAWDQLAMLQVPPPASARLSSARPARPGALGCSVCGCRGAACMPCAEVSSQASRKQPSMLIHACVSFTSIRDRPAGGAAAVLAGAAGAPGAGGRQQGRPVAGRARAGGHAGRAAPAHAPAGARRVSAAADGHRGAARLPAGLPAPSARAGRRHGGARALPGALLR